MESPRREREREATRQPTKSTGSGRNRRLQNEQKISEKQQPHTKQQKKSCWKIIDRKISQRKTLIANHFEWWCDDFDSFASNCDQRKMSVFRFCIQFSIGELSHLMAFSVVVRRKVNSLFGSPRKPIDHRAKKLLEMNSASSSPTIEPTEQGRRRQW